MEFKNKIPSPPLDQFIESIVYFKDYETDYSVEKRLPDGKITLVIDLTDSPKSVFIDYHLGKINRIKNGWLSGVQNKYLIYESGKKSSMIVIEFKPGMSYPFLKIPLNKFTNCTLELEDIWGKEFLSIREQIIDSDNADISFNLLENFLIRKTKYNLDVNPYVSYFIENIQKSPQMITLVELIKNIGYSNKHFINIFKKNVGTTPKHFSRIKRFQNIVSLLEQKNKISWSQLAIEAGYYDQAHFINEFKNFSGLSPTHYDKVKGDYPNYIPMVR